jgi:hypothetical protein
MSEKLKNLIGTLLEDAATVATIATLDENGAPHSVPSPFLGLDGKGFLVHLELLETSTTHRNLLRSIWFDRPVSVTLTGRDGRVLVATGKPHKAHVSGPIFSEYYREVRARLGDADLAAVWLIEPLQIRDETYLTRKEREEALHPFHMHLDRLVIADIQS